MTSFTVTVELQVATLLLTSVTVKITVFGPRSAQVNEVLLAARDRMPQASEETLLISSAVIEALPLPSSETEIFLQFAVGAM